MFIELHNKDNRNVPILIDVSRLGKLRPHTYKYQLEDRDGCIDSNTHIYIESYDEVKEKLDIARLVV